MTALVQLERSFDPPLQGFQGADAVGMVVTRAEVTFCAGQPPHAVLRGLGLRGDGSTGFAKRVAALDPAGAFAALPAEVQRELAVTASEEALELAQHLE